MFPDNHKLAEHGNITLSWCSCCWLPIRVFPKWLVFSKKEKLMNVAKSWCGGYLRNVYLWQLSGKYTNNWLSFPPPLVWPFCHLGGRSHFYVHFMYLGIECNLSLQGSCSIHKMTFSVPWMLLHWKWMMHVVLGCVYYFSLEIHFSVYGDQRAKCKLQPSWGFCVSFCGPSRPLNTRGCYAFTLGACVVQSVRTVVL